MNCVICKTKKFEDLFEIDGYKIIRCPKCMLVVTQREKKVSYHEYHRDEDYKKLEKYFGYIFQKRFNIISRFKKRGRVLEVGASTGVMLDLFKKSGFETWGIEPSTSAKVAKQKKHKILKTTFEKAKLPKNYFDVVILNHTLEHMEDPVYVLKKAKSILKKKGIVYVDVPNFGSLAARILFKHWSLLLPEEHNFHFTPKTLKKIFGKAGLRVIWSDTWSGIYDVDNIYQKFWHQLTSGKPYMYRNFVLDVLGIPGNILATSLNRGSSLAMIGEK